MVEQMALTNENDDQPIGIFFHRLGNAIGHGFVPQHLCLKKSDKAFAGDTLRATFGRVHFVVDLVDSIAIRVWPNLNGGDCGNEAAIGEGQTF